MFWMRKSKVTDTVHENITSSIDAKNSFDPAGPGKNGYEKITHLS